MEVTKITVSSDDKTPDRDKLKNEINTLIWMYADSDLTLIQI